MSSVSPSSSVSKMEVKKGRVGLEQPQAPSFYLGDMSAVADVSVRARVLESYYLALAKYYEAVVDHSVDGDSVGEVSEVRKPLGLPSASGVSSASSSRRRRRRAAISASECLGDASDFMVVPSLSYLMLVRSSHRYDVRVELGESPALSVVMALSMDRLLPIHMMNEIRYRVDARHLEFTRDTSGMSISALVSSYAYNNTVCCGSLGGALSSVTPGRLLSPDLVIGSVGEQLVVDRHESGYDYVGFLRQELSEQIRVKVGAYPTLLSIMQLPMTSVVTNVLDKSVDFQPGEYLRVCEGSGPKLGEVAATAIALSGVRLSRSTLGAFVVGKYCAMEGTRVNMWWRVSQVDVVLSPND